MTNLLTTINLLIPALIAVESGGDDNAVGDGGAAVGCLQIRLIVLVDVNHAFNKLYSANERRDRKKAIEIATLYLLHWGRRYEVENHKSATPEVLARIWNGGPNGWKKPATKAYWRKVKKELKGRKP